MNRKHMEKMLRSCGRLLCLSLVWSVVALTVRADSTVKGASLSAADRRAIQQLINESRALPTIGARMNLISARLLGRPYITHPLVGSATQPEQFVTRMDGFDCVTFLETVLALAGARDVESALERLRALRYANGEISYAARLHYTTHWNRANIQRRYLQDLTQGANTVTRIKTLNKVAGFAPQPETVRYFPKASLPSLTHLWQDGDLIYFVSGRASLDTNHVGILFRVGDQWVVRHASRNHGGVVEQPITVYCQQNLMVGFMFARPLETR
jgi:hypothetical protein